MITITVRASLPYDNEIQFFDVCKGIADKLSELGEQALSEGNFDSLLATGTFVVSAANDDNEPVGTIRIKDTA
jgi:hypothetical protein